HDQHIRNDAHPLQVAHVLIRYRHADTRDKARKIVAEQIPDLQLTDSSSGSELLLVAAIRPEAQKRTQELALKQNIQTLHNRINELGLAEPVIQQQRSDPILVQLPRSEEHT